MGSETGISGTNDNKSMNYRPKGKKAKFLILTNSVLPTAEAAVDSLYNEGKSASVHYFIDKNGHQDQFHSDENQSFTCGNSSFRKKVRLNEISVNLMFINTGDEAYPEKQKNKFIAFLKDFKKRHSKINLKTNLLGLGEVAIKEAELVKKDGKSFYALTRKEDGKTIIGLELKEGEGRIFPRHIAPGKIFWREFAEELAQLGFGLFKETTPEQKANILYSPDKGSERDIFALQKKLKKYGYAIEASGIYDEATKAWVTRFNQRYVPGNDEELDAFWTKASQISLDYVLKHMPRKINLSSLCCGLFRNNQAHSNQVNNQSDRRSSLLSCCP